LTIVISIRKYTVLDNRSEREAFANPCLDAVDGGRYENSELVRETDDEDTILGRGKFHEMDGYYTKSSLNTELFEERDGEESTVRYVCIRVQE
jgi:hypothetical protein